MFGLFRRDPRKRLEREIRSKAERAMQMQRSGKLQDYAVLTAEVAHLEDQLAELERRGSQSLD